VHETATEPSGSGRAPRRTAIALILTVATATLVLAIFSLWLERQALNTTNWTATSSQLLADPKIEQAVGNYLVSELFSSADVPAELRRVLPAELKPLAGPAAGGLQLLAARLVPKLLATPAIQDAWRTANRMAHRELLRILNGGGTLISIRGGEVTLNLYPLVFDVIGGDIQKRSASLIRAGGTLVTVVGPPEARPADGLAVDFVVESQLSQIVERVRDGRLRTNIGNVANLDDAVAALNPTERPNGKTIIRIRP